MKNNTKYDMIDSLDIDELIMLKQKKKYLDMHPYAVWQSKDGKYWYTTLPDSSKDRGVRQIRRKSRTELDESIIEYWESNSNKTTIGDIFTQWNDNKLALNKIGELTHLRNVQIFAKHCGDIKDKPIEDMKAEDFADFLEEQVAAGSLTSKAFANLKSIIRGVIKYARKQSIITYTDYDMLGVLDIADRSFRKVIKEDDEEVFDDREMNLIINYLCDNLDIRNKAILLMFVTGLRVGELVALQCGDLVDNMVHVRRTEIRLPNPEGGSIYEVRDFPKSEAGIRDVIVPKDFLWLIKELCCGEHNVFVFLDEKNRRLTTNSIRKRLSRICDVLKIKHKSPHKIRKTYCSILLDNGVDKKLVIEQSGHSDISCTEHHYHINRRTHEKKSEIIDAIPDFHMPGGS